MSILDNEGHDPMGLGNMPSRSEITKRSLPTCVITGRIAGDSDACGDCDPCSAAHAVPDVVKRLLAEKDEWRGKYGQAMEDRDEQRADNARLRASLKGIAEFCSGDDRTLSAIGRLASIRNTALLVLAIGDEQRPGEQS